MEKLKKIENWEKKFEEKGANLEHNRWAKWQKYVFGICERHYEVYKDRNGELVQKETGGLVIPEWAVRNWTRQINTFYKDLTEKEKESDRKETRNYLPIIRQLLTKEKQKRKREREKIKVGKNNLK